MAHLFLLSITPSNDGVPPFVLSFFCDVTCLGELSLQHVASVTPSNWRMTDCLFAPSGLSPSPLTAMSMSNQFLRCWSLLALRASLHWHCCTAPSMTLFCWCCCVALVNQSVTPSNWRMTFLVRRFSLHAVSATPPVLMGSCTSAAQLLQSCNISPFWLRCWRCTGLHLCWNLSVVSDK